MTFTGFDDRIRAWLMERDPGDVPEALRASASRVPFEVRRPLVARMIERGLPMTEVETRFERIGVPPRLLATAAVVVLLLVGLAIGLLLLGGAQPRLPAPYGPAANGRLAFAVDGDIYTVDPVTRVSTALVTGPEVDSGPVWSLDGTRLVFRRKLPDEFGDRLYLARADGGGLVSLTPEPSANIVSYAFSPDGRSVIINARIGEIRIANADGTGVRSLDPPLFCLQDDGCGTSFRPPDGDQIVFEDGDPGAVQTVNVDGTGLQTLVPPKADTGVTSPVWSPDGARVAYGTWHSAETATIRTHIVNADGTEDRALAMPRGAVWDAPLAWSNDGTRLAITRGYGPFNERTVVAVIPADKGGLGIETDPSLYAGWDGSVDFEWAPDDSAILVTRTATDEAVPAQQVLIDPRTGEFQELPWQTVSVPAWQRVAP